MPFGGGGGSTAPTTFWQLSFACAEVEAAAYRDDVGALLREARSEVSREE